VITTTEMFPETVGVMTRYGYETTKDLIPVGPAYMQWAHLRYASGTSLETMRTEMRTRNFNEFEIDLILEYLDTYVRTEMKMDPDNSRTEYEEGLATRCNKFRTKLLLEMHRYFDSHTSLASKVVPGASYVVTVETSATWMPLLSGSWTTAVLPGLSGYSAPVTKEEAQGLLDECVQAIVEIEAAKKELSVTLDRFYDDLDAAALVQYDVVAFLQNKLPWLE